MPETLAASDHDLIIEIRVELKHMRADLIEERAAATARANELKAEFEAYKRETDKRFRDNEAQIANLQTWRAQILALSGALATLIGILIKVFWPSK